MHPLSLRGDPLLVTGQALPFSRARLHLLPAWTTVTCSTSGGRLTSTVRFGPSHLAVLDAVRVAGEGDLVLQYITH
jgi:hypothetical protein